jgi:HEAT repeat protein/beta-lactamase regulating signal transducer with metallopeptidase domain
MESVLIGSIVKATLLLLAAFGITALMRGTSAAARHAVWSAALVGVIVVPLVSIALPWRMGVLPSGWGDSVGSLIAGSEGPAFEDLSRTPTPTPTPISELASATDPGGADHANDVAPTPQSVESTGQPAVGGSANPIAALARDPWRLVLFAWLGIAAVILARILFGMAWMWRLARRAQPLSGPTWLLSLGRVTERLDLRTAVRVVKSDAAAMPVTCGVLRPAVVLPEESEGWTEERREAVLLHELAHIRRGDLATHLIAWVACSLYWFHPLVWIAARRLRHESERACDDLVLGAGTRASEYAGHLLDIVRTAGRGRAPAAAVPMAQKSSFEGRLLAILEPSVDRKALSPRMKVAVAAALALVVLPLAAMAPAPPGLAGMEGSRVLNGDFDDPTDPAAIPLKEKGWESNTSVSSSSSTSTSVSEGEAFGLAEALDGLGPIHFEVDAKSKDGKTQVAQGTIDALETALDDADADVRRTAAEALGSLEDPRAVDALLEALRSDSDETVRKMAAWALGEIESPRAVAGLSQAVRSDRSTEVRAMAAWALGEIESPEGVDALGAALRDSSVEVRRMAVWGLGEIESVEAVEWLTPALRDDDVEIRRKAAWALGEIESATAVPALGAAMGDSDAEVRSMAAWALGEIESPAAIDALRAGVRDSNVEVRRHTVWALGEIQDARGVAPLSQALADDDREVRKTAVWALGEIQDPSAIPALRPLLQDPDAEIRQTAIWALVEMDDPAVYEILVELLKDEDPEVRKQAAHALGDL